jgi:hypothetical protein
MDLADETVARLNRLAVLSGEDLVLLVRDLVRSVIASTPSCLAVIITLGQESPFYAVDDRLNAGSATVRSSLRAQIMTQQTKTQQTKTGHLKTGPSAQAPNVDRRRQQVVFLAEHPGEYANFAAALPMATSPASGFQLHHLVIDVDLHAADALPVAGQDLDIERAIERGVAIDQAIGVLLDRGLAPDEARQMLLERAKVAGDDVYKQALKVLGELGELGEWN